MMHALVKAGLQVQSEVALPVKFHGVLLDNGYRIDLLVNDQIIIELKAVDGLLAIHQAQLRSYLKHSGKRVGLLLNFSSVLLKEGIRRVICG
jgi:GxxExxY protein